MHGRWLPNMEEAAGRGTQLDRGQALKAASKAAHDAVVDALRPLVDQAQAELETAAAERDAIVRQGHL